MISSPISATLIKDLLDAAFLIVMAAWTGALLTRHFLIRPVLNSRLDRPAVRRLLAAYLPSHYYWCATCGAIALPACLGAPLSYPEFRSVGIGAQAAALLIGTLMMLHGANSLAPRLQREHAKGAVADAEVDALIQRTRRLDFLVLPLLLLVLIALAFRPAPRSVGIIEPTPQERSRREFDALRKKAATRPER